MRRTFARCRYLITTSSGASAVEFALVAPVLFFLILGLAQLSLITFTQHALSRAVETGARHLIFASDDHDGASQAVVQSARETYLDPERLIVSISAETSPYPHAMVTASYMMFSLGPWQHGQNWEISAQAAAPTDQN